MSIFVVSNKQSLRGKAQADIYPRSSAGLDNVLAPLFTFSTVFGSLVPQDDVVLSFFADRTRCLEIFRHEALMPIWPFRKPSGHEKFEVFVTEQPLDMHILDDEIICLLLG